MQDVESYGTKAWGEEGEGGKYVQRQRHREVQRQVACRRCMHDAQSDIIRWKRRSRMHEQAARARVCARVRAGSWMRGPRGNRANPIRRASGTNGGSMFYRYCSRRGTDTSRVGRRAYIARAFSRLPEDLWISVCLSPLLPPLRVRCSTRGTIFFFFHEDAGLEPFNPSPFLPVFFFSRTSEINASRTGHETFSKLWQIELSYLVSMSRYRVSDDSRN